MPAGTWNLGRLKKRVDYVGLKDMSTVVIRDTSVTSDSYFNITNFPNTLTGGKNLFKIKANANTLVRNSKIYVEVLDANNNPIYNEPISYLEQDGTRVIAIWIYPQTPTGTAKVFVAGRARVNAENGRILRSSQNVNSKDYFNLPNVLWSRTVPVAPFQFNTSEIIFTKSPIVTAREVVQPYLQPVNLTNVATQSYGNGWVKINPKPSSVNTTTTTIDVAGQVVSDAIAGALAKNTVPKSFGTNLIANAVAQAGAQAASSGKGDSLSDISIAVTSTQTSNTVITALDESVMTTENPFFTSEMEQGDIVTIINPIITPTDPGAKQGSGGLLVPQSQTDAGDLAPYNSAVANQTFALSGSYNFLIDTIYNTKKADVVLLETPAGFKNSSDANTGGKWQVTLDATGKDNQVIDKVDESYNYTASFTLPFVTSTTEQSQSFCEIRLADIEPATGDVYKVKTLYKPGGMFGDFIDAGDTILEQQQILEDTGSFEVNATDGASYNRIGFFANLDDYNTYFTSSQNPNGGGPISENLITATFEPDELMSGIVLTPASSFNTTNDRYGYVHLKQQYMPTLQKNTQYLVSLNAYADDSLASSDPNINQPRLDIYISGSEASIIPDSADASEGLLAPSVNAYVLTPAAQFDQTLLDAPFADGGKLGYRVGTIEFAASSSLLPAIFRFRAEKSIPHDIYLVPRSGKWSVANLSIKTFNESKFTPNFTRINTRIPTEFINTPMTFKFQFFDIAGNKADVEPVIFPIEFTGDNTYINGTNNLITGSVYIGNQIGAGIEVAGVNSAFLRSIGYEGFLSASRTDKPGGFILYTGSILPESPDNYNGVGLEIIEHSESFLRFATSASSGRPAGLEVRTPRFYFGSNDQYVSGANGKIEISSSAFHLTNTGNVTLQGTITATAGGDIGGWGIGTNTLTSSNNAVALDADGPYHISASNFQVDTAGAITASAGKIADWVISGDSLVAKDGSGNNKIILDGDTSPSITVYNNSNNLIRMKYQSFNDWGILGKSASIDVFELGSTNQIAGWTFTGTNLDGGRMHINKEGFISSSGVGGWMISSSNAAADPVGFISSSKFKVSADGRLTASAATIEGKITAQSGEIGGWTIGAAALSANTGSSVVSLTANDNAAASVTTPGLWIFDTNSKNSVNVGRMYYKNATQGTHNQLGFSFTSKYDDANHEPEFRVGALGNVIAGWHISSSRLSNTGVHLSASYGLKAFQPTAENTDFVEIKYKADDNYGLLGMSASNVIFALGQNTLSGEADNQIAGWSFDDEKFVGGNMIIKKDGTIVSDGFASNVPGTGFILTANSGGFLEVENARIRGTLSTAVFEKESVNAVGGQLYVANSTTLTGSGQLASSVAAGGEHRATDTTMSVVNVTGFEQGEILSAKKFSSTGFATEYIFINSASRNDASSETDFSGKLFVTRGYSGSAPGASGSLGDLASVAQSYTGSQVIVSTGKVGTGYIRLNANPNDQTTPYIDIVERTGSSIYAIDLKARLGDLSGIVDNSFSDQVTGYGLYTGNGYFKGKIEVGSLPTPPRTSPNIHYNFGAATGSTILNQGSNSGSDAVIETNSNQAWTIDRDNVITGNSALELREGYPLDLTFIESIEQASTITRKFTISAFVKPKNINPSVDDKRQFIYSSGQAYNSNALFVSRSHAFFSTVGSFGVSRTCLVSASIEQDVYSHIAATFNNGTASIYVNGVKQQELIGQAGQNQGMRFGYSTRSSIGSISGSSGIRIATNNTSGVTGVNANKTNRFTGSIDEFRIYYSASLSSSEIESLFTSPGGSVAGSTVIEGGRIKTGQIQSSNFSTSVGTELNLNDGTMVIGGAAAYTSQNGILLDGPNAKFAVGNASGNYIRFNHTANKLEINTDNFDVNASGDVTMTGQVTATTGAIGGWTLSANSIGSGSSENQGGQAIRFNNKSTAGTNTYQSNQTTAKGLHIQTHASSNASSLIVGEIISDANGNLDTGTPAFNEWYGIQGIKWNDDQPYFQLAFKSSGGFEVNNSIAGWTFDKEKLSVGDPIRLELKSTTSAGEYIISSSNFQVDTAGALTASGALINGNSSFRGSVEVTNPEDFTTDTNNLPFKFNGTFEASTDGHVIGWVGGDGSNPLGQGGAYLTGSSLTENVGVSLVPKSGSNGSNVISFKRDGDPELWCYAREAFAVDTSHDYRITARWKMTSGSITTNVNEKFYLGFNCLDENFDRITTDPQTHTYAVIGEQRNHFNWGISEGTFSGEGTSHGNFKVGTKYVRPMFIMGHNNSIAQFEIDYIFIENLTTGEQSHVNRMNDTGLVQIENCSVPNSAAGSNVGEMILHGHNLTTGIPDTSVSASIYYKGAVYQLPYRTNMITGIDNENTFDGSFSGDKGYIVFDTRAANDKEPINQLPGPTPGQANTIGVESFISASTFFARLNGTQWQFDTNGGFTNFTPNINHCIIGTYQSTPELDVHNSVMYYGAVQCDISQTASLENNTTAYSHPNLGGSTTIQGNQIKTGRIISTNLSTTQGSEISLDRGTIRLGGTADPNFTVDEDGLVFAANFTERFISVNNSNSSSYLRTISGTGASTKKNLVFDGSLGGNVVMNMEISTSQAFIIDGLELPITGSDKAAAKIYIVTTGMKYDDGSVTSGYNQAFAQQYIQRD